MNFKKFIKLVCPPIIFYIINKFTKKNKKQSQKSPFSGVYKQLDEIKTIGNGYSNEEWMNNIYQELSAKLEKIKKVKFLDNANANNNIKNLLPLLIATFSEQKKCRIFDFGGGAGISYIDCLQYNNSFKLEFYILETNPMCNVGTRLFKNNQKVTFMTDFTEELPPIDIVHIGSSLQYVADYKKVLSNIIKLAPEFIFFVDTWFAQNSTFATQQVNMKNVTIPIWIFSYQEIINLMEANNYRLIYKTPNYQPIHNMDNFEDGLIFKDSFNLLFEKNKD
ncbi:MAG TPA: methyltransferase, TIGR04325 family [Victivallales bacterium]|nr:methyltransferase, TIGR04325 family [Victivallales bacterium]